MLDVYEIFPNRGVSGDWNSTHEGERYLFLVRLENGRYHVVRDYLRSIFPVTVWPHSRLPLDDSHSLWERIALMNFHVERNESAVSVHYPYFRYVDPGMALSRWRVVKLERGLVRHPSQGVRMPACRELLQLGSWGQDECWEMLSDSDKAHLHDSGFVCCSAADIAEHRHAEEQRGAKWWWNLEPRIDNRRVLTAINNRKLRTEFCRLWDTAYPDDHDNGCPADQPPPATIVTDRGDVPLTGPWPH